MITIPGQLSIRTIHGKNGAFNVAKLNTHIGDFVVKDSDIEQYPEGKYDGDFMIQNISPTYYMTNGRLVVEVKAQLAGMTLSARDNLSSEEAEAITAKDVDPIEHETSAPVQTTTSTSKGVPTSNEQTASTVTDSVPANAEGEHASDDQILFGHLWPLGSEVKLDSTVDRLRYRKQIERLQKLGYLFDQFKQVWSNAPF
ncbi:DUF3275 family protein [Zophobihabitans entericus]|uniref:DUF3275 family protein n=1 Tax=Zophobihabitans entericus TaxID=1635327 RepID=A0A6G9IEB1_9GAMM|nr:DUF3275 family protein [Zophobihabitans entericus]QIQ22149.1 DUF3275 family protein [Zophobihabitans entericus]